MCRDEEACKYACVCGRGGVVAGVGVWVCGCMIVSMCVGRRVSGR